MRKPAIILVSVFLLLAGGYLFSGGQQPVAEEKPEKMVLMNAGSLSGDPGIDYMRQEWGRQNGITIEVIEQAETHLFDKELAALSTGDPSIDIMAANERWVQDWAAADWLEPLDDVMKDIVPRYTKGADVQLKYQGTYYAAHGGNMVMVMYYRTDLLREFGRSEPPKTWDELIAFGKWATKDLNGDGTIDQWGVVHAGQPVTHFGDVVFTLIHQLGGKVYDDNKITVNSPEGREALQAIVDLRNKHKISPPGVNTYGSNECLQALQSGSAAMVFSWTWMGKLLNTADSKIAHNWSWALLPVLPGGKPSSMMITTPLVLNKASRYKSYAKDFIHYYTSYEGQVTEVVREFGNVALMPDVYDDPRVKNPPAEELEKVSVTLEQWTELQARILEAVKVVELERARKQGELDRALWPEMNAALSGIKTVEKALADAEIQMKRINEGI
ncbi:MAG: sugar ABC transporter substrate-binding protein [Spirochaetales bacterium]|nr:sugar ABC transporter substrate-binding protein [Spirochaetales bacterium]